jgi:hypothetical protein
MLNRDSLKIDISGTEEIASSGETTLLAKTQQLFLQVLPNQFGDLTWLGMPVRL